MSARRGERPRVELEALPLDPLTRSQVVDRVIGELSRGRGGWLATPNLDQFRLAAADPALLELLAASTLTVADGMPLVWASRLQRQPLPERVAGSDLVWMLAEAAATAGRHLLLIGGEGDAGARAVAAFAERYPSLGAISHTPLPMGFDPADADAVAEVEAALVAQRPDLIFIGLGFPKQDQLIAAVRSTLPGSWFMGVGVSLSFVAGEVRRAPPWLAAIGLEWLHRLAQEPRRLWRRYLIHDIPFSIGFLARSLGRGLRHGK